MVDDWREQLIVSTIKGRIDMFKTLIEDEEKDTEWAEEQELPELADWHRGRSKGYAAAQSALQDILKMFPGGRDA